MIRVHRIPFSTNVERVTLAAAFKRIDVEWVDHDRGDRAAVVELSGQALVPVAEIDGEVVVDSMRIVERLEREHPEPRLYPEHPAERERVAIFVEWFNEVWKGPPNALDADDPPRGVEAERLSARIAAWSRRFEGILAADRFLCGDAFGAADVCAHPFLRYAVDGPEPDDDESFHAILHRELSPGSHPALDAWVERIASSLLA